MAKLCIRERGNTVGRSQPGDVISVVRPAHVFSFAEQNCGQYRIIDVPDGSQDALSPFLAPKIDVNGDHIGFRAQGISFAILNVAIGGSGTSATLAQITAATVLR